MKRTLATASCAAVTLLATLLTGCSGSSSSSASGSSTPTASTTSTASGQEATPAADKISIPTQATVATKSVGNLGTILVDAKGRTLYLFVADKKNKSTCTGACAVAWPALLTVNDAKAGKGADKKLLGITQRSAGLKQVTYNGHPLYYYVGDGGKAGKTTGQGVNQFGALWYVVNPKGKQVTS
ncbi:COG4315 family predicted lipoprotein [Actinacidiphila yeochonensis]|uniref:COG4315 family predicted lipoprotein n=1 Tax=Actinacidiphila yeochonensis TaxID=89050 RepID=UPI00056BFE91|nr:lipoprotein [Actinacidiphila yeochonensis]